MSEHGESNILRRLAHFRNVGITGRTIDRRTLLVIMELAANPSATSTINDTELAFQILRSNDPSLAAAEAGTVELGNVLAQPRDLPAEPNIMGIYEAGDRKSVV